MVPTEFHTSTNCCQKKKSKRTFCILRQLASVYILQKTSIVLKDTEIVAFQLIINVRIIEEVNEKIYRLSNACMQFSEHATRIFNFHRHADK